MMDCMMAFRLHFAVFLLIVFCLLTLQVKAASDSSPVTIGIVADNAPYSSLGSGGLRGFSLDILEELSRISGVEFDYRVGSWSEIYAAFLRGELDAVDEISWREDRADKMLFTRPYHLRHTVIMHDENRPLPAIEALSDLKGYRIGTLTDIYYAGILKESGLEVVEYGLQPDLVRALAFGWVDAIIGPEVTLGFMARQQGFVNIKPLVAAPLGGQETEDFRIAVHLNRPELYRKLDEGLAAIDPHWIEALRERWQEYGGKALDDKALRLTPAQQLTVRQQSPLRVGLMSDYAPLSFEDGGRVQGLSVDILARVMDLTGLQATPVVDQWSVLIELLRQGEIDVIANISDLEERRSFTRFTQPYHQVPIVVFTRNPDLRLNSPADLRDRKIAVSTGIFYESKVREWVPEGVTSFDSQASMFRALASGTVDLVLAALPNGNHWVRELGLTDVRIAGELQLPEVSGEDLRFGLRPELEPLVPIINAALAAITPTEMRTIENRWLGAQLETNGGFTGFNAAELDFLETRGNSLSYCIHPDWMPLEGLDGDGRHQGLSATLLDIFSRRSGIAFNLYPTRHWQDSLAALGQGQCDLLPLIGRSVGQSEGLALTTSFYTLPSIVLGRIEAPFIGSLNDIGRQPVGIVRDSPLLAELRRSHPGLHLVEVDSETDGLKGLQRGEWYGYISTLATASQKLQDLGLADIRVIGRVPLDLELAMATAATDLHLSSLMQTLVSSLSSEDLHRMDSEWRTVKLQQRVDYTLLWQILALTAVALFMLFYWNRKLGTLNRKLAAANARLAVTSTTDELTGLGNRTSFEQHYEACYQVCQRNGLAFLVAMVDADLFKQINDRHGHAVGDECLRAIGRTLRDQFRRETDHLIRFGGEEFVIFAVADASTDAAERLERLRDSIERLRVATPDGQEVQVTVSIGYCRQVPQAGQQSEQWLRLADRAVYEAKRQGRNRVVEAETAAT
jgi:diguanylate cyclase (GGDEF)-like protein